MQVRPHRKISLHQHSVIFLAFFKRYLDCKTKVHEALCDSIDTKSALEAMRTLVGQCNIYIQERKTAKQTPNRMLLQNIGVYLTKILRVRTFNIFNNNIILTLLSFSWSG